MTLALHRPRTRSAAPEPDPTEALAAVLAGGTAEVVGALLRLVDAADRGEITRTVAAAESVRSELSILIGSLRAAATAGATVPPDTASNALRAHLSTATYVADLGMGGWNR
ncbi:hypothetical protein [Nocardia sp. CC201C]|uniref:hypothetical protein n=1 Tax=Nocardia sp. CC201C TaxID=3044575 RepID=UPI0024A9BC99|nr:hypothetical protein [Nocardia sp. CC201C]